jgi:1,2-phenylacetyl-CoA epoxidase PaaB subunit
VIWIVHRVVIDHRSTTGTSWRPTGWVRAEDEKQALQKAANVFGKSLKLIALSEERDWGWF